MNNLNAADASYLRTSISEGNGVLILGAGTSANSKNARHEPVKTGKELARLFATKAGFTYSGESLPEVMTAVMGSYLSEQAVRQVLRQEYYGVSPSPELVNVFRHIWKRVYTWNIDDALENLPYTAQRRKYFNGLVDRVASDRSELDLHIVYLHGQVSKPEHGFIFSEAEYARHVRSQNHYWYRQAADDFLTYCPIFIGTLMSEPILAANIELAKRESSTGHGKSFLITPDDLSPIKIAAFEAKGIVVCKAGLEDFSNWLRRQFPDGANPRKSVLSSYSIDERRVSELSTSDLNVASELKPIFPKEIQRQLSVLSPADRNIMAKRFLRGFPPDWRIAASDIPVMLSSANDLERELRAAISRGDHAFVTIGQSGSGKTTATMMALLRVIADQDVALYESSNNVPPLKKIVGLLSRIHTNRCIIYVPDLFLFGDTLKSDLREFGSTNVMLVSTARSGEWQEHFARYLDKYCTRFSLEKFGPADYEPLIERLVNYVPAPSFKKLSPAERLKKLQKSKFQLLIALREATESQTFEDVITHEFERLPDDDTRLLCIIVGLATIARVGISPAMAREAYAHGNPKRSYQQALDALEGIVSETDKGRLVARHELYVRHLIDKVSAYQDQELAVTGILGSFTKFEIPVIRSVSRPDAQLFRTILNHDFLYEVFRRHNRESIGEAIYQRFEIDFELDGHFWLQYGLYLVRTSKPAEALEMLRKSIQAYPENTFAVHAYADLQLKIARRRTAYDAITIELIKEAVTTLLKLDARDFTEFDQYPIVTLAYGHTGALIKHQRLDEARQAAARYFDRLQQVARQLHAPSIEDARISMMRFCTLGEWEGSPVKEESPYDG